MFWLKQKEKKDVLENKNEAENFKEEIFTEEELNHGEESTIAELSIVPSMEEDWVFVPSEEESNVQWVSEDLETVAIDTRSENIPPLEPAISEEWSKDLPTLSFPDAIDLELPSEVEVFKKELFKEEVPFENEVEEGDFSEISLEAPVSLYPTEEVMIEEVMLENKKIQCYELNVEALPELSALLVDGYKPENRWHQGFLNVENLRRTAEPLEPLPEPELQVEEPHEETVFSDNVIPFVLESVQDEAESLELEPIEQVQILEATSGEPINAVADEALCIDGERMPEMTLGFDGDSYVSFNGDVYLEGQLLSDSLGEYSDGVLTRSTRQVKQSIDTLVDAYFQNSEN